MPSDAQVDIVHLKLEHKTSDENGGIASSDVHVWRVAKWEPCQLAPLSVHQCDILPLVPPGFTLGLRNIGVARKYVLFCFASIKQKLYSHVKVESNIFG